ncbi:MAG: peptidylprolyl isomerase [Fibrobacter sp.]|nr:peptidylprolyl isomerase [Fibrobacter sp.]
MMIAKAGDTVQVHYKGTLSDNSVFDSSEGRDPLEFTIGSEQVIPGFDSAVNGMKKGEKKTVTIQSSDAYGEHRAELVINLDRERLPEDLEPEIGRQLQLSGPEGQAAVMTIIDFNDTTLTLDANHPLAGKDLTFEIELVGVVGE